MTLFGKEMKRILRTGSTRIFLAAALFFSVFMAYIPITYETFLYENENGQEVKITGREALKITRELEKPAAGTVTAEKMSAGLEAYHKNLKLYGDFYGEFPRNVYHAEIRPYSALVRRLHEVMADPDTGLAPDYLDITQEDAASFYERCDSHLTALMRMEQKDNPAAQKMAAKMYEKVEKPFTYYPGYGSNMMEYLEMYLFILVFVCALITAPLFSAEYQTGADDILRCTKKGRRTLALTKIAAAFCIAAVMFVLCMTIFILISNSLFGWESAKTSMQVLFSAVSLLNLNLGGLQALILLAGALSLFATVSFTLFLSAAGKNTTMTMGLAIGFCLAPALLYFMVSRPLGSWLRALFPAGGVGLTNAFLYAVTDFEFLKAGPFTIWTPWLLLIVPALEIPVFGILAVRSYCKRSL